MSNYVNYITVINTKDGILLIPLKSYKQTSIQQVLGCTGYKGPKKSLRDMKKGIIKGAKKNKNALSDSFKLCTDE